MDLALGMKFATQDADMFLTNVAKLEQEGVTIGGFELQAMRRDTPETVVAAVDLVRSQFSPRFQGLHPPFPCYADNEFLKWDQISSDLKLDYTVLHAAVLRGDWAFLEHEVRRLTTQAKSQAFLENIPLRLTQPTKICAGSLTETSRLHSLLLFDIPHAIHNFEHRFGDSPDPVEQVRREGSHLRAVHVADNLESAGIVPVNGGSPMFQAIMAELFKLPGLWMVAEPKDGHLDGGRGHKDTCREIWKLWQAWKDNHKS
ncbi:MAG TPA: hypothetical protein ENN60_00210 [archaeon]|nr:hypothetical protein [archaeon]